MTVLATFEDPVLLAEEVLRGNVAAFDSLWDACGGDPAWTVHHGTAEKWVEALAFAVERRRTQEVNSPSPGSTSRDAGPRGPRPAPSQSSLSAGTPSSGSSTTALRARRRAGPERIADALLICVAVPVALTFIALAGLIVIDAVRTLARGIT